MTRCKVMNRLWAKNWNGLYELFNCEGTEKQKHDKAAKLLLHVSRRFAAMEDADFADCETLNDAVKIVLGKIA